MVPGFGLVPVPLGICSVEELVSPPACLFWSLAAGHVYRNLSVGHHRETALQYHVSVIQQRKSYLYS